METLKKMHIVLVGILIAMVLGCSKEDEFLGNYKLICIDAHDESRRDEEFFNVYEKYGIFYATLTIEDDRNAYIEMVGTDEIFSFSYNEDYFIDIESNKKDGYKYENNEISISSSDLFNSSKAVFKKMTPEETYKLKNGYSNEEYQKAESEAEELLANYIDSLNISELSGLEKTRISNDRWCYDELAEVAQIAVYAREVERILSDGHSYKISFSKNGIVISKDNNEVTDSDPFCQEIEKYISNYKQYKVGSKLGGEYIIDVLSDGTVQKTKAP